jgi:hypothetical protein
MEQARRQAATTLQSLIFLGRGEEKRLRLILVAEPTFMFKMQTRADLEKCLRKTKVALAELAKLQAEV